jgi:activator of 2-hydroxyglutaryl-CoA dehydratase
MESDIVSACSAGRRDDLIAGLAYAVVHNYLNSRGRPAPRSAGG